MFSLILCRFLIQWHLLGIWCYWQRITFFFIWTPVIHIIHVSNVRKLKNTVNEKVTYLHSNLQLSSECTPVMSMSLTKSKSLIFSNYLKKFLRSFPMAKIVLIFKKKPIMFKWLQKTSDKHRYQCVNCTGEGHWKLY